MSSSPILKVATPRVGRIFWKCCTHGAERYVLNEHAKEYLENQPLAQKYREQLIFSDVPLAISKQDWLSLSFKS